MTSANHVTPRDIDLLRSLDYSPLTARQLLKLSATFPVPFTVERKARARLQRLTAAGQVRRWPMVAIAGRGGPANTYSLTLQGYRLLHGIEASRPSKRAFSPIGIAHQLHTHALGEFLVHTLVAAAGSGIAVTGYCRENSIRLTAGREAVSPDTGFQLEAPACTPLSFFVELDTGSERLESAKAVESWQRKIRVYEAVQDEVPTRFRVLVVCTGSRERTTRILALAGNLARNPGRRLFYAVHLDDYLAAEDALFGPCFTDHRGQHVGLVPAAWNRGVHASLGSSFEPSPDVGVREAERAVAVGI
jgi:hypothetical protein